MSCFLAQSNDTSLCDYGPPTADQSISQESQDARHSSDPQTLRSGQSTVLDSLDLNLQSDRPAGNFLFTSVLICMYLFRDLVRGLG